MGPLIATLLALAAAAPASSQARLSRAGGEIAISLVEEIGGIEDPDPGPRVEVYGDGRFFVHFPDYMKKAGDYEGRLSTAELEALVALAEDDAIRTFEPAAVRARVRSRASETRLHARSAAVRSRIALRMETETGAAGAAPERRSEVRKLAWRGLRADAARHADEPSLRALGDLERRLRALREHPDLRPTGTRR